MIEVILKDVDPKEAESILELYIQELWSNYFKNALCIEDMLSKSTYVIGAYYQKKLVGFIRGFCDGHSINFIQDLIVREDCKRKGIGSMLVKECLQRFSNARKVALFSDNLKDKESFYKACGFSNLDNNNLLTCFILDK